MGLYWKHVRNNSRDNLFDNLNISKAPKQQPTKLPSLSLACKKQVCNEKKAPGCLGYIGDQKLPSYVGIMINNDRDPC